ncbi:MAG: OmpA family protein, partial [Alphaproteobacteria bacterium]
MRKTRRHGVRVPTELGYRPIFIVLAAFVTAFVLAGSLAPAQAEETAKTKRPSVEVDLSVLDDLPAAKPGEGGARITLRPPRAAQGRGSKTPPAAADQVRRAVPKPVAKARPAPPTPIVKAPPAAPKPVATARPAAPKSAEPKPAVKTETGKAAPAGDSSPPAAGDSSPPAAAREVANLGVKKPISIAFAPGSGSLPKPPPKGLEDMVQLLAADDALRIVIYAYAKGSADSASKARRLSFSRALAVRRYLVGKGVRGTRA